MSRYAKIILVIVLIDLVSTICGIKIGYCEEANPLLGWALGTGGINLFVTLKIGSVLLCLGILEFVWQKNLIAKIIMERYWLTAIASYCFSYLIGFIFHNSSLLTGKIF